MKGQTLPIEKVMMVLVAFVVALIVLGIFTGIAGGTFNDGKNNAQSAGCEYQRQEFFNGTGDLGSLDERCVEEENEQLQIDMVTAQENVEIVRCMNSYVEENGDSENIVGNLDC